MAQKDDKDDSDLGNLIGGLVIVAFALAAVAATLSVGLFLLGGVAAAGAGRGVFAGLANFGAVFVEAHSKLP